MSSLIIKNAILGETLQKEDIVVENGKIASDGFVGDCSHFDNVIDAEGMYALPGFVELHAHGGGGYDFMDCTDEAFEAIVRTHLSHGTTSILPTTVACSPEAMILLFEKYRRFKDVHTGLNLIGLHLEGPFVTQEMRGAQNPLYVRTPSKHEVDRIISDGDGIVRMCTAAPEIEGIDYLAAEMQKKNIVLSIGHSNATYKDIEKAYDMGFRHVTHLYSNTPTVRKINQVVCAGVLEAAYLTDGMKIELIADGHHVPKEVLKLALKIKGAKNINLTSDAMRAAGTNVAESYLGEIKPENSVIIEDGVAKLPDRSCFAGSLATGDNMLRWAVSECSVSLPDAIKMLSTTPAEIIGALSKGSISKGKDADILLFDKDLNLKNIIVAGNILN